MWKKGQTGNPNGARRPKRWQDALDRALEQYESDTVKAGQALRAIADKVVSLAIAGDKEAYKEIAYRLDGPIPQDINLGVEVTGAEGLSVFGEFLAEALGRKEATLIEAVDTGGSVLPAPVRPTTQ